ncbi:sigma-70 family RNA polymerase sigma factor [Plantactinospora sp. B24E8]|uniref:RNA polymerase sigma factor n=1 Tax=Plantactinospora sp. B24E8 TaxID=3153567 RepID=UPI00325E78D0
MGLSGERGEDWFTSLYATHYPDVVRYGMRRTADMDRSVELAQEVFVVAWQRRGDVPQQELPWLYGVARKLLANWWRRQHRQPTVTTLVELTQLTAAANHPMSPDPPESAVELVDLLAALLSLPETDQEILRLVAWEELTAAEVASVLGCSQPTARIRLHRARRRLRVAMGQKLDTDRVENPARILEKGDNEFTPATTGTSRPGRPGPVRGDDSAATRRAHHPQGRIR